MAGRPRAAEIASGAMLGRAVRSIRGERGWSREDLAQESAVSINTIMKIEQGRVADPGFFTIACLASVLTVELDDLRRRAQPSNRQERTERMTHGVVSVGYQGRTLAEFVSELTARGVTVLVDVRLTPISRRAGFSKSRLAEALGDADIVYRHFKTLGNPRENRANFHSGRVEEGRKAFRRLLVAPPAKKELEELQQLAADTVVAVLCFERDQDRCHRKVIVDHLTRRSSTLQVAALS